MSVSYLKPLLGWALVCCSALAQHADSVDLALLEQSYEAWVAELDGDRFAADHLRAVAGLDSVDPQAIIASLKMLAASGDAAAVPWIAPYLESADTQLVIHAGMRLNELVAAYPIRRQASIPGPVVTLSPAVDLRPVAWLLVKMLALPDDGNTHAYACTMAGNLGLQSLVGRVRACLSSRHPAVSKAARYALQLLGASQGFSADELAAAEQTALAFAELFRNRDEDGLGRLLLSRDGLIEVLAAETWEATEPDVLYPLLVEGTMDRFLQLRGFCGDLEGMAVSFRPGAQTSAAHLADGVRMLKNSKVVFSYAQRVEIAVKIEEMVLSGGSCYILKLD